MADGFAKYVGQRHERLCRTAYLLTRDWQAAEDLVQTTLVKAWTAWRRIEADPDPYVYRILVNTHASWWRRRWRGEVPTEALPEYAAGPDLATGVAGRSDLWAAVGTLPPRQRAALVLRYFDDLTPQQVADALGCSVGSVKKQLSRALARLRVDPALHDLKPEVLR
ncbi:SigE family RNA polymerase sigma factor [Nonomuraea sp. KC401]|uniref:SigE family RNA polymerase sigma factor n=1 Tax=Nonomuraea longispora TaxID=1848320 RepID=A0A4R4N935_9ACTN|nr:MULTISPECIES: SigE family RNA polymerase sigma factor [Nonomuraea]NBE96854.1 SigE family RNA polymerase sigma factor [Nonomuraea sp. K271]TDC03833.1 SigE family RNA polymerase sigma factor [Nonomuraea longispora]TLF66480.1 SigE family RNA polymerase sigma factor [Nonomuraea sp. KC401]